MFGHGVTKGGSHDCAFAQVTGGNFRHHLTGIKHQNAITEMNQLGHLGSLAQYRPARVGEVAHHDVEFVLGTHVDAACWIEQEQYAALCHQPF